MTDQELIRQLKSLRQIEPNKEWAVSARANLINVTEESRGFSLFTPLPRAFSFVASSAMVVLVLVVGGFVFYTKEAPSTVTVEVVEKWAKGAKGVEGEKGEEGVKGEKGVKGDEMAAIAASDAAIAALSSDDDGSALAEFRAQVKERLQAASEAAGASGSEELVALAEEAEEFYAEGDYDSALRVITALEQLLE